MAWLTILTELLGGRTAGIRDDCRRADDGCIIGGHV
jgi:hypothetical protein